MKRTTAFVLLFASWVAACGTTPAVDAATDETTVDASDIVMDAVATDCGFEVEPAPDASVCFQATSCNGSPFCPALFHPEDRDHLAFRFTQFDIVQPELSGVAISILINQILTNGNLRLGFRIDRPGQSVEIGMLNPNATPQPGTNFMLTQFTFVGDIAPTGDGGAPDRWRSQRAHIDWPDASDTWSMTERVDHVVVSNIASGDEIDYRKVWLHDVHVSGDCIGFARPSFDACEPGRWFTTVHGVPTGILEFDFTIAGAMAVGVNGIMGVQNVCDVLAGASCANTPRASWPHQPDAHVDSETEFDGWHWRGYVAAVASDIR